MDSDQWLDSGVENVEYGLIGEKLGHSFSAPIHEQLTGDPYELREIAPEELDAFMRGKDFRAINVTIPYKQAVIPYLDEISEIARAIGAVNTVVNRYGKLYGDNTDCDGLTRLILRVCPDPAGKKTLVLGTGGTSRTAVYAARMLGADPVIRVSRGGREGAATYEEARRMHSDAGIPWRLSGDAGGCGCGLSSAADRAGDGSPSAGNPGRGRTVYAGSPGGPGSRYLPEYDIRSRPDGGDFPPDNAGKREHRTDRHAGKREKRGGRHPG